VPRRQTVYVCGQCGHDALELLHPPHAGLCHEQAARRGAQDGAAEVALFAKDAGGAEGDGVDVVGAAGLENLGEGSPA
jgi:hypothetical protein